MTDTTTQTTTPTTTIIPFCPEHFRERFNRQAQVGPNIAERRMATFLADGRGAEHCAERCVELEDDGCRSFTYQRNQGGRDTVEPRCRLYNRLFGARHLRSKEAYTYFAMRITSICIEPPTTRDPNFVQELPFTGCDALAGSYNINNGSYLSLAGAPSLVNISGPPDVTAPVDVLWDFNGATVLGSCEEVPFDPHDFDASFEMRQESDTAGYVFALKDVDTNSTVLAVSSGSDGIAVEWTRAGANREVPSADTTELAFASARINTGHYYVIRLIGSDSDFSLYVDGTKVYAEGRNQDTRPRPLRLPLACDDCLLTIGGRGEVTPDRSLAPDRSSALVGGMANLVIESPDSLQNNPANAGSLTRA